MTYVLSLLLYSMGLVHKCSTVTVEMSVPFLGTPLIGAIKTGVCKVLCCIWLAMGTEWLVTVVCCCRYVFCTKCFSEIQGDTVTVGEDLNSSRYRVYVCVCY